MTITLDEFAAEFRQDVLRSAEAAGEWQQDAFFDVFCEHLVEAGELDHADRAHYRGARGVHVDGYGGDPRDAAGVLTLIINDFDESRTPTNLTATEMKAAFARPVNFLKKALEPGWRNDLEETAPGFGLADLVARRWAETKRVRLFLLSNRKLSERVDGHPSGEIGGRPVTHSVWDIRRLHRFTTSGQEREDLDIDFETDFGGGLPLLRAHATAGGDCESYLAAVPGSVLGAIYDRWGTRLLEQNVRVFLQARGKVNRGIRDTIERDPEMFFAYNNGITATAEDVVVKDRDGKLLLVRTRNLQIVNGGQTTASLHIAYTGRRDLSGIFVQMKLSKISPSLSSSVVPLISEYANTQNRVTAADFFANHPFHIRMEEFSRRLLAPSSEGTFAETKWFYERARGQFVDARARLSRTERKKFDLENPRSQLIRKTDMAKFMRVWDEEPHVVSLGAQKNFASFAADIGKEWKKSNTRFGEAYFREVVAKAIVFRKTERIVSTADWYEGGYRANVVAYAIAKLAHDVRKSERAVDFELIWRNQALSPVMETALASAAETAYEVLTHPQEGMKNVTEWAKKQACWERVRSSATRLPPRLVDDLISTQEQQDRRRSTRRDQRQLAGIEAQLAVMAAGGEFWRNVEKWGSERALLSTKEQGVLRVAGRIPDKIPTEAQVRVLVELLARLVEHNDCPYELPKPDPVPA